MTARWPGRIAVTGATGFLGYSIVSEARQGGAEVIGLARRESAGLISTTYETEELARLFTTEQVNAVIHAAGQRHNGAALWSANVDLSARVADAAIAAGVNTVVLVSSLAAAANSRGGSVEALYGRSKKAAEERLRKLSAEGRCRVTILRPGSLFGEDDPERHFLRFARMLKRGWVLAGTAPGGGRIDIAYVGDVARSAILCANGGVSDQLLVAAESVPLVDVTQSVAEWFGKRARILRIPAALASLALISALVARRVGVRGRLADPDPWRSLLRRHGCQLSTSLLPVWHGWRSGLVRTLLHYRNVGLL